jgi:hypothetical protein
VPRGIRRQLVEPQRFLALPLCLHVGKQQGIYSWKTPPAKPAGRWVATAVDTLALDVLMTIRMTARERRKQLGPV